MVLEALNERFWEQFSKTPQAAAVLEQITTEDRAKLDAAQKAIAEIDKREAKDMPALASAVRATEKKARDAKRAADDATNEWLLAKQAAHSRGHALEKEKLPHQKILREANGPALKAFMGKLWKEHERLSGQHGSENSPYRSEAKTGFLAWLGIEVMTEAKDNMAAIGERLAGVCAAMKQAEHLAATKADPTADFEALWAGLPDEKKLTVCNGRRVEWVA